MGEKKLMKVKEGVSATECYPINLVEDLVAGSEYGIWDIYIPEVLDLVAVLPNQERVVIEMRYRSGKTLEETGQALGKTRERVRQIQHNVVGGLRKRILSGECRAVKSKDYLELVAKYNSLCEKFENMCALAAEKSDNKELPVITCCEGVDTLDLSARTRNCLQRAGLETITDVIRFDKDENTDWNTLWGFGARSGNELRTKIFQCTGYKLHI